MLLSSSPPAARHVVDAAFAFHGRGGKQLVSQLYLLMFKYSCFLFFAWSIITHSKCLGQLTATLVCDVATFFLLQVHFKDVLALNLNYICLYIFFTLHCSLSMHWISCSWKIRSVVKMHALSYYFYWTAVRQIMYNNTQQWIQLKLLGRYTKMWC